MGIMQGGEFMKHTQMVKLSTSEAIISKRYVLRMQLRITENAVQRFENEGGKPTSLPFAA